MPYTRKPRARVARRRPATKKVTKLSTGMKKAIKRVVASVDETKYVAEQWDTVSINARLSSTAGTELYPMIPSISEGVGAADRIGNAITPKGIKTHFAFSFPSATLMTTNVYVRLLCLSSRQIKSYEDKTSLIGENLFLNGQGSAQDIPALTSPPTTPSYYLNMRQNQFLPVNKKSWIVHHDKIIHFARNYGYANNDTTAGRDPNTYVPLYHRCTLVTPFKGVFKYDGPSDPVPNNFAPFWCAYMWTADQGDTTTPLSVDTRSEVYYTG